MISSGCLQASFVWANEAVTPTSTDLSPVNAGDRNSMEQVTSVSQLTDVDPSH